MATQALSYGATLKGDGAELRVWAPLQRELTLRLTRAGGRSEVVAMERDGEAFVVIAPASAGDQYSYLPGDGTAVPDPVSRFLPEGVHDARRERIRQRKLERQAPVEQALWAGKSATAKSTPLHASMATMADTQPKAARIARNPPRTALT